ncbi:hypothetical protein L218DRAFT_1003979 [Marasmius fiardii PR-910]|nr:hypothetical protein L218DRAFT_1003979 [Marasmius fiardii PR-910]
MGMFGGGGPTNNFGSSVNSWNSNAAPTSTYPSAYPPSGWQPNVPNTGLNGTNRPLDYMPLYSVHQHDAAVRKERWNLDVDLGIVEHIHGDGSPCTTLFDYAAIAKARKNPKFVAVHKELVTYLQAPIIREMNEMRDSFNVRYKSLEIKCSTLEEELERVRSQKSFSHTPSRPFASGPQDSGRGRPPRGIRNNRFNPLEGRPTEPSQKATPFTPQSILSDARSRALSTTVGYNYLTMPFVSREMELTVVQYIHFCPGYDLSLIQFAWDPNDGLGVPSSHIENCVRTGTPTTPIAIPEGERRGLQTLPLTFTEGQALRQAAIEPGNYTALRRLCTAYMLAEMISQVAKDNNIAVNPFIQDEKDILTYRRDTTPDWAKWSRFISDSELGFSGTELPAEWKSKPIEVPAVDVRANGGGLTQWCWYYFLNYDPRGHAGLISSNSGFIDADAVLAQRIWSEMTPERYEKKPPAGHIEFLEALRMAVIEFIPQPGLYPQLLEANGIEIAPTTCIRTPEATDIASKKSLAAFFASCGLKVETVSCMLSWAWQYCLDVQHLPGIKPDTRNRCLEALNSARFRLLFFPVDPPTADHVIRVPDDWNRGPLPQTAAQVGKKLFPPSSSSSEEHWFVREHTRESVYIQHAFGRGPHYSEPARNVEQHRNDGGQGFFWAC